MIQAIQLDSAFAKNIGQIVLLGGSFAVNGNVNPAAEANVRCLNYMYIGSKFTEFNSNFMHLTSY